jgi:toxin HigB-1
MIKTYGCKETERFYSGDRVAKFVNIESVAIRKLQMLDAASSVLD